MSIHMGIPRYDIYERPGDDDPLDECARGRVVLYSDHLTDKQAALDALQISHAAEVERLTAERDAAVRDRDAAVEALRFYAEQHNFEFQSTCGHNVMLDHGEVARAALAKIGGERG